MTMYNTTGNAMAHSNMNNVHNVDALFNIQRCPLRLIDRFGDRADKRNDGVLHGFLSVEKS